MSIMKEDNRRKLFLQGDKCLAAETIQVQDGVSLLFTFFS